MPDEKGRKVLKVSPRGDPNTVNNLIDEIYEVFYRRGYCICDGIKEGHRLKWVLCKMEDKGKHLKPLYQVGQIVPDYGQPNAGVDIREVGQVVEGLVS